MKMAPDNNKKTTDNGIINDHRSTAGKDVITDKNSNHRLSPTSTTSSAPSNGSSSSHSSSSTRKSPKRHSITVKTAFNIRPSHIFLAICIVVIATIPFFVFESTDEFLASINAFFFPPILKAGSSSNINTKSVNTKNSNSNSKQSSQLKTTESLKKATQNLNSGGWRAAEPEILEMYDPQICNIDKVSVTDLTPGQFAKEYRYKKPVIITFPKGAADWTDPTKWTRSSLKQEYSKWTIRSGSSVDIVRKGGNGDQSFSFTDFLDKIENISSTSTTTKGPRGGSGSYMFDRDFYFQSSLPRTLRLPEYLTLNDAEDDSIFFLGASLSGVVFHKHSDTWNGVVYGRKRWFLYSSISTPPGGVYNGFSVLDWLSDLYPQLSSDLKPTECVQEAGEILYLPEGWYHATLNLGDTVAFAIQKTVPVLDTEILFYEATELINSLQGESLTPGNREIRTRLVEIYTELHRLLPESSEVVLKLGEQLYELKQHADSLHWFQAAIDKDPNFVMAYVHKGKSYSVLRQYAQAEELLRKAMELSPNLWDVYKEYGGFLMKLGRHEDALPIFKKGTELMPGLIPFWYFYQQCQMKVGDMEGAEDTQEVLTRLRAQAQLQNDT